ncbi:MAG: hypothetical protein F2787_01915 [Actinobacteria bacterium]|uniref:Unannotated protein n=1 Tax=freshwater metagenome TaxID=449393 RepID=A0A6J7TPX0_9ZZZZ|nr:prepilin peptidase [Actinomycetota bacterium]MSW46810.1 hypothetical protein [Actinomycetota bacterium]MSX24508.1 hypothetical protein [Actinomycetota bacterium]MSY46670.1 hypothetical protein [Actinomycetota bacterium]MTB00192.1 hypothetical protein [Actinomycetota bacterium]
MNLVRIALGITIVFFALRISFYDLRFHRIRNTDLLVFASLSVTLIGIDSVLHKRYFQCQKSLIFGALLFVLSFVVYCCFESSIGAGDIKLLPIVGFDLSYLTESNPWQAIIWILLCGGLQGLLGFCRDRTFSQRIAFAPAIFLGSISYFAAGVWSHLTQ